MNKEKIKPLDAKSLKRFGRELRKLGYSYNLLEEFFDNIDSIIFQSKRHRFKELLNELIEEIDFDSNEDVEKFASKYIEFHNSVAAFLEQIENNFENIDEMDVIFELSEALMDESPEDKKALKEIITDECSYFFITAIKEYGFDITRMSGVAAWIEKKFGDITANILLELVNTAGKLKDMENPPYKELKEALWLICTFAIRFNMIRKGYLKIAHSVPKESNDEQPSLFDALYENAGRNDPCPCGSGKKYKKCCMERIENPLSTLKPVPQKYAKNRIDEADKKYICDNYKALLELAFEEYSKKNNRNKKSLSTGEEDNRELISRMITEKTLFDIQGYMLNNFSAMVKKYAKKNRPQPENYSIVKSWEYFIAGEFTVVEVLDSGSAVFWHNKTNRLYHVHSLYDDFREVLLSIPAQIHTVLLPYKGKIVYSGFAAQREPVIDEGEIREIQREYVAVREKGDIVYHLDL